MKRLLKCSLALLALILATGMIGGCTGKNGAVGPAGQDNSANLTCTHCHANNQTIVAKEFEWSKTKHGHGETFIQEAGNSCATRCHNGAGYLMFTKNVAGTQADTMNATPVNCRTCHNIHVTYDTTDWALTNVAPVKLFFDTTLTLDLGKGNLCATCHQSRTNPKIAVDSIAAAVTPVNVKLGTRWGGHHGPTANMIGAVGGWENGTVQSVVAHKLTANNGCVHCHVSDEGGKNHLFDPTLTGNIASCNSAACHALTGRLVKYSTAVGFIVGTDSVQNNFNKLMAQVRDTLVGRGALILATTDTATLTMNAALRTAYASALANAATIASDPEAIVFPMASVAQLVPRAVAGLAFNYWLCLEDKSEGCHNLQYERYLLVSALAAVNPAIVPVYHN